MSAKTKKFRSKWFRVAVEGATTDGRKIERTWLSQIAKTYNPITYGARIFIEHIRGLNPEWRLPLHGRRGRGQDRRRSRSTARTAWRCSRRSSRPTSWSP